MKNSKENPKTKPIKSLLGENNRLTKTISVSFLILLMSGLLAFIITGLYGFGLIDFPEFIKTMFLGPEDAGPGPEKGGADIYGALREQGGEEKSGFVFGLTIENVREAIKRAWLPDNLHIETYARYYTDGKEARTEEMSLWKKGEKYKYTLAVNSKPEESYINDAKYELIENFATGSRYRRLAPALFSFDNIPHTANINYYLDLLESGEITGFSARRSSESEIIEIEYSIPELSQTELIYIAIDTGIVERKEVYAGARRELYYVSETKIIEAYYDGGPQPEITAITDSLFETK